MPGAEAPSSGPTVQLALALGMPIVPVCVRGMYRLLPKGTFIIRPSKIEVYVAPQIETKGLDERHLRPLMDRVRAVQEGWLERKERLGDLCLAPIEAEVETETKAAS